MLPSSTLFTVDSLPITLYLETSRVNVIQLFTAVIYHHYMVILSFCVSKLYYLGNYHGMAVNYGVFQPQKK